MLSYSQLALPITLDVALESGGTYTAIAQGYVDTSVESNGFSITPFVNDLVIPDSESAFLQIVHATAASTFATVTVMAVNPDGDAAQ